MRMRVVGPMVAFAVLCFGVSPSWALSQFGIQYGSELHTGHMHDALQMTSDCRACHVNPTGGGMRNDHGREFSVEKLPLTGDKKAMEKTAEAAKINEYLTIGADFRLAYLHAEQEAVGSAAKYKSSFFPMQADFYAALTPIKHLTIYYQDGVEASRSRETFVLVDRLPYNAHIKVGRFIPPYGLKLDDHTSFIRDKLGFKAPSFGQDVGLEVGFGERRWFGNAAVFNGNGAGGDDNRKKGLSATGGWKSPTFWLAGSLLYNDVASEQTTYVGGYGAFNYGALTLLGELDLTETEGATKATGSTAYAELDWKIRPGIIAKLKYDRHEPDKDTSNDELDRYTVGMDFYPYAFTEVTVQYRVNEESPEIQNDQALLMLHLYF